MAGIYIHIPFCKQACHYCDFHFSTNLDRREELVAALVHEIKLQANYLQHEVIDTIYFGGGTPSLLKAQEIETLLGAIHSQHSVNPKAEVTLEANPDDLKKVKLRELYSFGINRLSIGIQSFDDSILKFFNRAHNSEEAMQCIRDARHAGYQNLSLDLIYAVPGQDHNQWIKNIAKAIQLEPEHLSSYTLTIEEKTAFGKWAKTGKLKGVDEKFAAEEFEILMDELEKAGFEHYEISNFCLPGFQSKHNSNYWKQEKYLGIGPSAHSYDGDSRQFNVSNNALYQKSLNEGKVPFEVEVLSRENKINEYIFTTLRTSWGCQLDYLKESLDYDLVLNQSR
ncbi:MAG TPA: radical SAM family heme chaperone HemW, partial [Cyclobacteriaceae bacterium]